MPITFSQNRQRERRVIALLSILGLSHWRKPVLSLLRWYAGLEMVVDDDHQGPYPETIHLLRLLARCSGRPNDEQFASLLAQSRFLDYRVRVHSSSGQLGEEWSPRLCSLNSWRTSRQITAWPALSPPIPRDVMERLLLHNLRGTQSWSP